MRPFNVSETQSQRNESLIVEFVVADEGAAGQGRGGRAEQDGRGGWRTDLKSLQEGSCLPNLPEMPGPPVCFPEVAPIPYGKLHLPWATEKGPKHPLGWHAT